MWMYTLLEEFENYHRGQIPDFQIKILPWVSQPGNLATTKLHFCLGIYVTKSNWFISQMESHLNYI